MNNKYEDQKSGWIIFHNKKKVVTNAKEKRKEKFVSTLSYPISDERKGLKSQRKQSSGKPFGMTLSKAIEHSNDLLVTRMRL
jgi:hypothetical protein